MSKLNKKTITGLVDGEIVLPVDVLTVLRAECGKA